MTPTQITFTGADARTPVKALEALSKRYCLEWGVLFSPSREGADPRYPTTLDISDLVYSGLPVAAHLCGEYAEQIMRGEMPGIGFPFERFTRIQINHRAPDIERVLQFATKTEKRVILQTRDDSFPQDSYIEYLHDRSGGRGVAPESRPAHPGYWVGYAGGLGPLTVRAFLEEMKTKTPLVGHDPAYWIDMESGVRFDDWFAPEFCEMVCQEVFDRQAEEIAGPDQPGSR